MIGKRYEQPKFYSDFYRMQYHKMLRRLIILSVVILLLTLGIMYYLFYPEAPRYYASTTTGQIIPMTSMQ
ncbi:MAG: hypothetical protein JO131_01785 [Gammaproteobacteria bacterium]|nr:hypothetical protein [Gammaproteobacteria bacterium]